MNAFWIPIDSEVLLLVFLPGLVFKDAALLSDHLFQRSIGQCLIFAFPMGLAGTVLRALFAFHVFPYDWSFDHCMTFGCILSAKDPVAVAALLKVTGALVRLETHIAGESLPIGHCVFCCLQSPLFYGIGLRVARRLGVNWQND
jgi:CPA1 family monovalent cation:H+ antiporter